MRDNIVARQLSWSQGEMSPIPSTYNSKSHPAKRKQISPPGSIEDTLDSNVSGPKKTQNDTRTSPKISGSFSSFPPHNEILDDNAPLTDFTRRLSNVAQTLADRSYKTPDSSDDSGITEEIYRSDFEQVATAAAAELTKAMTSQEMMKQILQNQQDIITKVTKEHITIEAQPPVQPRQDTNFLYHVAEEATMYGAEIASLAYQKHFCDGRLPAVGQARQLIRDNTGNIVDPRYSWLTLEPGNDPQYFYSTMSRCPPGWRCTLSVQMTTEEMYSCLRADAVRYCSAFMTSPLQMQFGGNIERQDKSQYPLINMEWERLRSLQQQHQEQPQIPDQTQTRYIKAQIPIERGFNQPSPLEQWRHGRQPSWLMDVDEKTEESPR
jgi:hypothetical protein